MLTTGKCYDRDSNAVKIRCIACSNNGREQPKFRRINPPAPNLLALTAAEAAYRDGHTWHAQLLEYLRGNRDYIRDVIAPTAIEMAEHDATYLAWLDVRAYGLDDPHQFFLSAGVEQDIKG